MLVNLHSYYSLRYGTLSIEQLVDGLIARGYESAVLTDINNSTGVLEFIKECQAKGFNGIAGMEYRDGNTLLYIGIAKNPSGFKELNDLMTESNLQKKPLPKQAPEFNHTFVIYPFGSIEVEKLRDNEFIGIKKRQLTKIVFAKASEKAKYVILQPVTFTNRTGYELHSILRAINGNTLKSKLEPEQLASTEEVFPKLSQILDAYEHLPELIYNTRKLLEQCSFPFNFNESRNKKVYTVSRYDDKELLSKLAFEGMKYRYGTNNKVAVQRVEKELEVIDNLGFSAYFLITNDIVRYGMNRGYYHVGRGSGANSVVAYCLKITDVCPIELDLYFERFLNPKRKSPPDFDIDYAWDERDDIFDYIFKRYGSKHTALMGAMNTFKDRSIIREIGKVYGLPKGDIDRIIDNPGDTLNRHEITRMIMSLYELFEGFPNLRTIHASGVLISEEPITNYCALDMPPKGFQTMQFDMHISEDIGFEKFDILSQMGIANIRDCLAMVKKHRKVNVDIHDMKTIMADTKVREQLKSGDTIGAFYIESPAMRGLLTKLHCEDYLTLVAASSIIRPGVAKSGMMRAFIERFHDPSKAVYLHPIMEELLKETYGVMVYQEDVLKVGIHFGGLDGGDADFLRRMMSGKGRSAKHLKEIEAKYYSNCQERGISEAIAREVWRQIESFAGYSFSKAHSGSFAVESFQNLYLKVHYPIEYMVAVQNNRGGYYPQRVYINEAKKSGAKIHLPCVNRSQYDNYLYGIDIFVGFKFIQNLENSYAVNIPQERYDNGPFLSLENFVARTNITLDQAVSLIRVGALRFIGKNKKQLLWEAHSLLNSRVKETSSLSLFKQEVKEFTFPKFEISAVEDIYDEIELLHYPVSESLFTVIKEKNIADITSEDLIKHVGKDICILGDFIPPGKYVPAKNGVMCFGAFLDKKGNFFSTTHFPYALKRYPFQGSGIYKIIGKVTEDFDYPSIEVREMIRMPIHQDPRTV